MVNIGLYVIYDVVLGDVGDYFLYCENYIKPSPVWTHHLCNLKPIKSTYKSQDGGANGFIILILKINKHNQTIVVTSRVVVPTPGWYNRGSVIKKTKKNKERKKE